MAGESRSFLAKLGLNTQDFSKGVNEAKAELTELNSELLKNRREQKQLEEQIKSLVKQQKSNKNTTEEEKEKYEELQKEIDKATIELAELKTEEQSLRNQVKNTNKEIDEQSDSAQKSTEAWKNVGNALKTAAQFTATAVAGMFTYTTQITAKAGEIDDLAKQTGLTVEEVQKLMYAAELSGTSYDTITSSMAKLVKNMATAQKGTGDAAEAFKALNVDVDNSAGVLRDNQDVFNEVIEKLGNIEDETQRDAYAMAIFGKSAQDLNPLILGGTEQLEAFGDELEREGLLLSQTELDKLNEFDDKWVQFQSKLQAGLMGTGSEAVDAFDELFEMSDEIISMISKLVTGFAKLSGFIVDNKESVLALVVVYGAFKTAMSIGNLIASVITVTKSLTTATEGATVAQTGMNAACNANPYVLLASALAALTVGLVTYAIAWNDAEKESLKLVGTNERLNAEVEKVVESTKAENAALISKGERYEELRKKLNRTVQEEQELYSIASELEAAYPNQIELIGDEAGSYNELGNQIDDVCSKLEELARKQALVESLTERYKTKLDLETRIKEEEALELENNTQANPDEIAPDGEAKSDKLKAEYKLICAEIERIEREYADVLDGQADFGEGADVLNNKLVALGETTKLLSSAEEELASTNELSEETLNKLASVYPEVQDEINDYINGVGSAENVINHLNIAYQNDVANNKEALQAKLNSDTEYYKELQKLNDSAIDVLANEYGIDLSNYESYGEAKLAIQSEFLTKLASNWQKYYDEKNDTYIIDERDLIQYKKELMMSGMSSKEADAEIKEYKKRLQQTKAAVYAWKKFETESNLDYDLTEYSKWYTPQLLGDNNDSGDLGSNTTSSEITVYEKANEAFKQLTEERIEEIQRLTDAETAAVDERIEAINAEIKAREKLKDSNDLQEQIDYINAQLKYSQLEEFERFELERKLKDLEDEKAEEMWLETKNAEISALQAEKTARDEETAALVEQLKANQSAASTLFTDLNNGYQSVSSIINNNSQQANVNIITEALSLGQVQQAVKDALGLGLII